MSTKAMRHRGPVPRTYRAQELFRDVLSLATRVPSLLSIRLSGRLPPAMREKVIVAVAQTNACRMCEHAHTRMALEAGVTDADLAALERMDETTLDRRTWLALAHARELVQTDFARQLDLSQRDALERELGRQTVRDIEDVARVMTVANRIANSLNALSDRRHGHPIPGSRFGDELLITALFLPAAWLGTLAAAARQRKSPLEVWRKARSYTGGAGRAARAHRG